MSESPHSRAWAYVSGGLFLSAVFMGAGPGTMLINPAENERALFLGMPILYAWGVFWFFMQIVALALAYLKVWRT